MSSVCVCDLEDVAAGAGGGTGAGAGAGAETELGFVGAFAGAFDEAGGGGWLDALEAFVELGCCDGGCACFDCCCACFGVGGGARCLGWDCNAFWDCARLLSVTRWCISCAEINGFPI